MEKENSIRTHRVGTITAGLSMIVFGVLFLLHLMGDLISYDDIFSLWPFMLIGLGAELLISNFSERKIVYDKAAIFLTIFMTILAVGMAVLDVCIKEAYIYFCI